jgi:hypothetical protein
MATQLSQIQQSGSAVTNQRQVSAGFFDQQSFELMMRIAKGFSTSSLVPKEYQNNIGNCMIALNLANRLNADPLMTMQNLVIVHGRPTWSAQYLISTANMCGRFSAIRYEFFGEKNSDGWGCRAWAIENSTGEKLVGSDVTIGIAKKEGWYGKNGSKWQSIPQQMLMYRAGAWWVRAYAPELSMGLQTSEEVFDVFDAKKGTDGAYSVNVSDLKNADGTDDHSSDSGTEEHPHQEENNPSEPESEEKKQDQKSDADSQEQQPEQQTTQKRQRNNGYEME